MPRGCEHLHPNADAHERDCARLNRFDHRFGQGFAAKKLPPAMWERAVTGQHNAVGLGHDISVRGDDHIATANLRRHTFESFLR